MMLSCGSMKKNMTKLLILAVFFGLVFAVSVQAANVSVSLRYQDTLVLDAVSLELPLPGTVTITDTKGEERSVNAQSVLGVLFLLDTADASFELSKLQYFASFGSLYLQCITMGSERCDNWLYAVNGVDPKVGMDTFILAGGEQVYIYFGPSHQVVLSSTAISKGTSFQATAQNYQYQDNTWAALFGVTIGFTQPDPDNAFSPTEVLLQAVDAKGQILLNLDIPVGDYNVGIKEDFYFPTAQLTVVIPTPAKQSGAGLPTVVYRNLDRKKAMQFLVSSQNEDGSFGQGALFTDWAAVAFGAYGEKGLAEEKLRDYLLLDPDSGSFLTDYERRAMALMALGINPYVGTKTDYIQKISNGFDGTQFGDANLVNDDIFALVVLLHAGYEASENIIAKTVAFILSYQQENGSFGGTDITAAAVQALALVSGEKGVSSSLLSAKEYLKDQQENSGGFKNVYSTSWVLQAIGVLGESGDSWVKNNNIPGDYLYAQQAEDGGMEKEGTQNNRIWATAYAIAAAMQKSWGDILQNFKRPTVLVMAAQDEKTLTQDELDAFEAQIEVARNEIAKIQTQILAALQLKEIQQEISRIASAVEILQPKIASLYAAYLAQLESPQDQSLAQAELSALSILETGIATLGRNAAPKEEGNRLAAEVAFSAQNFFRSSTGQSFLVLGMGIILFLALGGWKVVLSLMRRPGIVV